MKRFITFILIITGLLCSCGKEITPMVEKKQELSINGNANSETEEQKNEKLSKIKKFYIPNSELMIMGRCFSRDDIEDIFPCDNTKKTEHGYNLIYEITADEKLVIIVNDDDVVNYMLYCGKELYDVEVFSKVNKGMTLEEISEILPSYIIYEKTKIIELVFDNGQIGIVELEKNSNSYFVKNKYISVLSIDTTIINSLA